MRDMTIELERQNKEEMTASEYRKWAKEMVEAHPEWSERKLAAWAEGTKAKLAEIDKRNGKHQEESDEPRIAEKAIGED